MATDQPGERPGELADERPGELAERLRGICLALPEVTERPSHSAPTWYVRDKKSFVTLWAQGHHQNQFPHLWCAAPPGAQAELIAAEPDRIFRPPYVGGRGWIGVRLDGEPDWAEIAELCQDAYQTVAAGGRRLSSRVCRRWPSQARARRASPSPSRRGPWPRPAWTRPG